MNLYLIWDYIIMTQESPLSGFKLNQSYKIKLNWLDFRIKQLSDF